MNVNMNANTEEDTSRQDGGSGRGNLSEYIVTLAAWWREIVLGAFLFAAIGGSAPLIQRYLFPKFEASALVAIVWTDDEYTGKSVNKGDGRLNITPFQADTKAGAVRTTLIGLVKSGKIAETVAEQFNELHRERDRRFGKSQLIGLISGEPAIIGFPSQANQTDLIRITAETDSPESAASLANLWAEEYRIEMNHLYQQRNSSLDNSGSNRLAELTNAYDKLKIKLEKFYRERKTPQLERQIKANEKYISYLQDIWHRTTTTLIGTKIRAQLESLERKYDTRIKLEELLSSAQGLLSQIEKGDEGAVSPNNELAIELLKAQAYIITDGLPNTVEINFNNTLGIHMDLMEQSADLSGFVAFLRRRIDEISLVITKQTEALSVHLASSKGGNNPRAVQSPTHSTPRPKDGGASRVLPSKLFQVDIMRDLPASNDAPLLQFISMKEDDNRSMRSQIENEAFMEQELTQERNLIQSTIGALQAHNADEMFGRTNAPLRLYLASPAVPPLQPSGLHPITATSISGCAALLIEIILVLILNAHGVRPFLNKRNRD